MSLSSNLLLPYILPQQSQKHVTVNEAFRRLDALVQLSVKSATTTAQPASPADGACYILPAGKTGADWGAMSNLAVAYYVDGGWTQLTPKEGWLAWVQDADQILAFNGSTWNVPPLTPPDRSVTYAKMQNVSATSRFIGRISAGAGDPEELTGTQATTLLDAFTPSLKGLAPASGGGTSNFLRADGTWAAPAGGGGAGVGDNIVINGDFQINQRGFAGGALSAGAFGFDRWKAATGGANATISGFVLTLASGELEQVIEPAIFGLASFASTQVTISAEAPSADLTITFGSQSGTITSGSGRSSVTLTLGAGDTGNLSLKVKRAAAGSVSFGQVKAETGASATAWAARNRNAERQLCERYFVSGFAEGVAPANAVLTTNYAGFAFATSTIDSQFIAFPTRLRSATPALTFFSANVGAPTAGLWQWFLPGTGWLNAASTIANLGHLRSDLGFIAQLGVSGAAAAGAYIVAGGWTASAEL